MPGIHLMFVCVRYKESLQKMRINEDRVVKVVKERIFSAAFHPCASSLLMAAGDKWGQVGIWNLVRATHL